MKTERRLYTAGRANGETSRCVDTFPGKAGGGLVGRALAIAALAVAAWCAHGGVWQDCTAWYMGGTDKDSDGVFSPAFRDNLELNREKLTQNAKRKPPRTISCGGFLMPV